MIEVRPTALPRTHALDSTTVIASAAPRRTPRRASAHYSRQSIFNPNRTTAITYDPDIQSQVN